MMRIKAPTFFMLLVLLASNFSHASDPSKNYELLPIWQKSALSIVPMDVNTQTPGEELIAIYPNQLDVLTSTSQAHQKSIIKPADKPYGIAPLPGDSPDSLRFCHPGYLQPVATSALGRRCCIAR